MKLSQIKKQLTQVRPFVVYEFRGIDDCLVIKDDQTGIDYPLSVSVIPPSISFILESKQITTLILRYSKTFREKGSQKTPSSKASQVSQQIMTEMQNALLHDENEQMKQVGVISQLGREYILSRAIKGWYSDENDAFDIRFTNEAAAAIDFNKEHENDDDILMVSLDNLTDLELINIGLKLIDALPKEGDIPANIPVAQEGEVEGGETESVPADKVADFPRNLRSLDVADVPPTSESPTRNPEPLLEVGS